MSLRIINTHPNASCTYVSLDTAEGDCVGHWIWECALFLPYIKDLQKDIPIKILLRGKKRYKDNILADFGFSESDIVYSDLMKSDGGTWQQKYVIPQEGEYNLYAPTFFYLWTVSEDTTAFFVAVERFRKYYIDTFTDLTKSIDISYVARSKKENYTPNARTFENANEFRQMLDDKGVHIIDIDELSSLRPQFCDILKSRNIIIEMGSAFQINAAFMAENSHIIVINDAWNYKTTDWSFFRIYRKLTTERNNTVEIYSTGRERTAFNVDINCFANRIASII